MWILEHQVMDHRTATVSVFHCLRKHSLNRLAILSLIRLSKCSISLGLHVSWIACISCTVTKTLLKSKAPGCHCSANVQISAWLRLTRRAVAMVPNWNDVPGQSTMHESLCSCCVMAQAERPLRQNWLKWSKDSRIQNLRCWNIQIVGPHVFPVHNGEQNLITRPWLSLKSSTFFFLPIFFGCKQKAIRQATRC